MKVEELTAQDKNMEFKPLNIRKEVQDEVVEFFQFKEMGHLFEAGILMLLTFAEAAKNGCKMAYFEKEIDGKRAFYAFDFLSLIEYLKDPNRPEGSTHAVTIKENVEKNPQQN